MAVVDAPAPGVRVALTRAPALVGSSSEAAHTATANVVIHRGPATPRPPIEPRRSILFGWPPLTRHCRLPGWRRTPSAAALQIGLDLFQATTLGLGDEGHDEQAGEDAQPGVAEEDRTGPEPLQQSGEGLGDGEIGRPVAKHRHAHR